MPETASLLTGGCHSSTERFTASHIFYLWTLISDFAVDSKSNRKTPERKRKGGGGGGGGGMSHMVSHFDAESFCAPQCGPEQSFPLPTVSLHSGP